MSYTRSTPFPNLVEISHPILRHKLNLLRERSTNSKLFKELTQEIALLIGYEALRKIPMTNCFIHTPLESFETEDLEANPFVIVPILRSGLCMAHGLSQLLPMAKIGHLGLYRDQKTLKAIKYYKRLPPHSENSHHLLCDPMLATGHTAEVAITELKNSGIKHISFLCIIAAPEGVNALQAVHANIPIFTASLDRELNKESYILPGLGDAGNRLYGTDNHSS
jgi:uracil phosphoribosyltransferase